MAQAIRRHFSFMKGNMIVLTVRQVIGNFCRRMVMPYASLFILAVGGQSSQIGLINSLLPLAGLIMFPLSGYLTDRRERVRLIALAGYLSAATTLLYVLAPSWEWIALAALIQGFMVFQFPPQSAILVESLDTRNRGIGVSTMNSVASAFALFSPYIAGIVLEIYGNNIGMRMLYALMALSHLANAVIVQRYLKDRAGVTESGGLPPIRTILWEAYGDIPGLFRQMTGSVKALGVVAAMGFIANGVTGPFWVVYITEEIGLSRVDWGLILLLETILMMVLAIPAGAIVDRYGRTRSLFISLLFSFISTPLLILSRGFTDILLIRFAVTISGILFMPASTALMAEHVPRELRGRMMAALGRGSVIIGATGGGTGGPGMGYFFIILVMVASISGGMLYAISPVYPWFCVVVTTLIQVLTVILFIRDPVKSEE